MTKATIVSIAPEFDDYIRQQLKNCTITFINDTSFNPEQINPSTEILGTFVDCSIDKTTLQKLSKLKMIATFSTGFDHIDVKTARKKKIIVSNVPTYGENTVAEHSMALILALSRKLIPSVKRVKEGTYDYHGLRGFDLKGKTIGVIGTGHIGMHLIDMLQGFDVTVIASDVCQNNELQDKHHFTYVPLKKLLQTADIISLHVPLCKDTVHMIGKKEIQQMKEGVYIINAARGGLIDPEGLVWGLETGKVAGAGLDTLEQEAFFKTPQKILEQKNEASIRRSLMENMIIDHPNTIVTPHNAFNSTEAIKRIIDTSIENIRGFLAGKPQNIVK